MRGKGERSWEKECEERREKTGKEIMHETGRGKDRGE